MSDCPLGCEWRYDASEAAVMARQVGRALPVVYDQRGLRRVIASEAPRGRPEAIGAHLCFEHPLDPEVLLLGPVEKWTPIRELNFAFSAVGRFLGVR
jgi:hypothetical protein